jgi:hypothetical protein
MKSANFLTMCSLVLSSLLVVSVSANADLHDGDQGDHGDHHHGPGHHDGPQSVPAGAFVVDQAVYFSNGVDAYCQISPDLMLVLAPGFQQTPDNTYDGLPYTFQDNGFCAAPAGFFRVENTAPVYYSNGKDAFCYVPFPGMLPQMGNPSVINDYREKPHHMRDDGTCKAPEGLFSHAGAVYFSNGVAAFCHVPSPAFLHQHWGNARIWPYEGLPTNMSNNGDCR